jgi:uncharacterized protein
VKQGDFVWYELCTTDAAAASAFYAKVVGWSVQDMSAMGHDYHVLGLGERPVVGVMTLPPEQMPPSPVWFGYVGVDDVDAKAAEIKAAGGTIHREPSDIPTIGRFAVVADPQGAVIMLFKGMGDAPAPLEMMATGTVGWHELHTSDWEKAWSFYSSAFGWAKDNAMDMGPMGTYQMFKNGGMAIGGMLTDPRMPVPCWVYYFVVDDIDAGIKRVQDNGGTVVFGPQEVPGGAFIINAKDPLGGSFSLVGMKKS